MELKTLLEGIVAGGDKSSIISKTWTKEQEPEMVDAVAWHGAGWMKPALVVLVCSLMLCGCGDDIVDPPTIQKGHTQTWYGRVNSWAVDLEGMRLDCQVAAESGVTGIMIEMGGWASSSALSQSEAQAAIFEAYPQLVHWCRSLGLWLFVQISNDNAGLGRHGDHGVSLGSQTEFLHELAALVKQNGRRGVIVQPVTETRTVDGLAFEQFCVEYLAGFTLVCNGNWGRPPVVENWAEWRAWHPFSMSEFIPDALMISDTSASIMKLSADGTVFGAGNPSALAAWAAQGRAAGVPVVGYYTLHAAHDPAAIRALGNAVSPQAGP